MTRYQLGSAVLKLDNKGCVVSLLCDDGTEIIPELAKNEPFLQLGWEGSLIAPNELKPEGNCLEFTFGNGTKIKVTCTEKEEYATFRVEEMDGPADALVFGPIFATLAECIGDVVGVVQGGKWALGIQALNIKTLAGFPVEFKNCVSPYISDTIISELSVAPITYFESAGYAAKVGKEYCCALQLYCENRNRQRKRDIMGHSDVMVLPMGEDSDADIKGAAFALFCCPKEKALETIGRMEVGEGLPHPTLDGEWMKTSRKAMGSYMIAEFGPENFEKLLGYTKEAGFSYLYHPEPFSNWGHFQLREDCFPKGDESMAEFCRRAKQGGIGIGIHTLSTFTTRDDPYVSPMPHPHLAKLGESLLASSLSEEDTAIPVKEPWIFERVTSLQTIQIGDELIRYQTVEDNKLIGCQRGVEGTKVAAHESGATVYLLWDHPYRVFLPNIVLQDDYSQRIGDLMRSTGISQISFDGIEGCEATGEDAYGINRFALSCWDHWQRGDIINDASRLNHNLWHIHTRMNWGEPWGAKMREGMIEHRIKNQDFYRRNLFPRMLGWFLIRKADRKYEATTPEDMEWALSMAAGFDAGFALSTSETVLDTNGCTPELLELIRDWEQLRLADAFSEDLREKLRDPETEWHLEKTEEGCFLLYPLSISKPLVCDLLELQPGQPGGSDWVYENPFGGQEYEFRMGVEGYGEIINPALITRQGMLKFPCRVKGNQYLWFRKGKAVICDRNYQILEEVKPVGKGIVDTGQQTLSFSCEFAGEEGPEVTLRVFTRGEPIAII